MAYESAVVALADPTRRRIVERLRSGPLAVSDLAADLPVSQPAVSQHLRVLESAGLVSATPRGRRRIYALAPPAIAELRAYVEALWADALSGFAALDENPTNSEGS